MLDGISSIQSRIYLFQILCDIHFSSLLPIPGGVYPNEIVGEIVYDRIHLCLMKLETTDTTTILYRIRKGMMSATP